MIIYKRNPDPRMKPPVGSILNLDHPLSRGLVGCWLMNEGGGGRIYNLASAKHNGLFVNSPIWSGGAIRFDHADYDYIDCGAEQLGLADQLTITSKILQFDTAHSNRIASKHGDSYGWVLLASTEFRISTTGSDWLGGAGGAIAINEWHTLSGNYNGSTLKIFIDANESASYSVSGNINDATQNIQIGRDEKSGNANSLNGLIDFVYIHNRGLSADEEQWLNSEPYSMISQPQYWYMVDFGAAGGTSYDVSLSLTQALSLTDAGRATAEGAVSLSSSQGLSDGGLAAAEGALPLTHNQAITIQADAIGEASLALAGTLALALSGNVPGFEASLGLSQSLGLVAAGDATAEGAFTLAYNLALQTAGGSTSEAVLSLAMSQGLTTDYIITIEGAVALAQSFGLTSTSDAVAEGQLNLSQLLAISTLAQAAAEAGISLGQVVSLTLTGTSVIAGLVTPDGRTYTISVEVRTLSVEDEDRTYTIN